MVDTLSQISRPEDRQRYTRQSAIIAASLRSLDRTIDCDIIDLSAGGAKIRAREGFEPGTQVSLVISESQTFRARVAWRDSEFLGLEFLEPPSTVAAAIPQIFENHADDRERRRNPRSAILWSGEIYGGLRRSKCELLNISPGGAKIRTSGNFQTGTEVAIRSIRFGEFRAEVIWQHKESSTIGIRFLEDDKRVMEIIERSLPSIRKVDSEPHNGS